MSALRVGDLVTYGMGLACRRSSVCTVMAIDADKDGPMVRVEPAPAGDDGWFRPGRLRRVRGGPNGRAPRGRALSVMLRDDEYEHIEKAAASERIPMAEYIRRMVLP